MRGWPDSDNVLRENKGRALVYLFALALVVRTLYLMQYARSPFFWAPAMDSLYNDNLALAVVHRHVPPTVYWRAPLYSYFLAGVYMVFGHSLIAARAVQELLGCISCCLVYLIGVRIMRPTAAAGAAIALALYGPMIFNDGELQSPALETALDLGMLLAAIDGIQTGRKVSLAAAGLLMGLSAITRPTILMTAPVVILAQRRGAGWFSISCALFVACCLAPPAAVTVRNALTAHDPVFISSQGGINLFVGNHDGADGFTPSTPLRFGYSGPYRDSIELYGQVAAERALGRRLKASEVDAYWTHRTLIWWKTHPQTAVKLALKKLVLMWTAREIRDNVAFDYVRAEWAPVLWLAAAGFWLAGPLGLAGIAASATASRKNEDPGQKPDRACVRMLAGYVLVTMTVYVAFFAGERFRLPAAPVLLLFAGSALVAAVDAVRQRDRLRFAGIAAAVLAGAALVDIGWFPTASNSVLALDYWSCGNRYTALGQYSRAQRQFAIALALDPSNGDIWLNDGNACYYAGEPGRAARLWRTAACISPNPVALYNLGVYEQQQGLTGDATRDFRTALRLDPDYEGARAALGSTASAGPASAWSRAPGSP